MSENIREYSAIESVPQEARHYGFWDMVATWIGANACTSSWYTGGVMAAVGIGGAFAVLLIANPIAYIIMALVGYMGYKVGTTTMGLTRASFGIRGSILPSVLNSIQFMGWCAANTFIAAISMSFLFNQLFGWPAFGDPNSWWVMVIGVVLCSILQILMTVVGGTYSIKYGERLAVILLVGLTVWQTYVILTHFPLEKILSWSPPANMRMRFGDAMDVMVAFSFGWVPAIAEFTRYTKNKKSATLAPMVGANVSLFWFAVVGLFGVVASVLITGTFDPNNSDPSSIVASLGLGWLAFLVLILATVSTNCVNIYVAGMSVSNIFTKFDNKKVLWTTAIVTLILSLVPIAIGSFLDAFMGFLSYVGLIFAPLLGIMLVDFYLINKQEYDWSQADKVGGAFWFTNGINWRAVGCWFAGVAIYFMMGKSDFIMNTTGAIYATLICVSILYYVVAKSTQKKPA